MRLNRLTVLCLCITLLSMVAPTFAQEFRGRINGTVTDNTGAVLPGVTVTASSPALIQPQVQVTGADGGYRFLALPPGVYTIDFELTGFSPVKRQDVRVVINQTLTVDMQLQVATLQETVTVTGQSPIVDTSTTAMGTNFTKELLTEIPNARDIWAAMAQAPGIQMTAFDVGGSNTGNQSGFRSYGFDTQNQTRMEGIDTTEGVAANAGYFDFGSFEEFQVGGAGADSGAFAGGAVLSISVKSGGDRFSGTWYSDYVAEGALADNVPDYLRTANQVNEDGYFSREPTGLCFTRAGELICKGNATQKQYDLNGDFGGPLMKGKAWFFTSWRLNDKYEYITGSEETQRSKLTNAYTFKGTFQVGKNNQIIGFLNKREKLQDKRGYNNRTVPLSAAYYQSSRNYPWKVEGTQVMGSRAFLDVLYGNWYNFFPLRPVRDFGLYDGPWEAPRIDTATGILSSRGGNNGYQDQKRYKPQFYTTLSYFQDGWGGSHDLRAGFDWKRDRRSLFNDQPFDVQYRDNNGNLASVDIYNSPVTGINDVVYTAGWISDTFKVTNRLTLNFGVRLENYKDQWPEQTITPNGIPALAGSTNATYLALVAPKVVEARTVANHTTLAPKFGFAYDLSGDNRTVIKGFIGQSRWNSADQLADQENPVGLASQRFVFVSCAPGQTSGCDLNGDRVLSSPAELGAYQTAGAGGGGGGLVRVDRDLIRPTSNEVSLNLEREITTGLSGRASWVYKNMRNVWGEIDIVREANYTAPITINDPGADRVVGTADDQRFETRALPQGFVGSDRVFTNLGERGNADFQNVEFAINRRFSGKWMLLTSFGMTWSTMAHVQAANANLQRYGNTTFPWRPADRLMGDDGIETSSLWNYKVIGRYVLPYQIGFSGSWKVQSGFNYGRTISVAMPVEGNRTIRVTPIDAFRYPSVAILDLRLDKSFDLGKAGKFSPMVDVFNLLNSSVPTNVRTTNTATAPFQEVTTLLNPRVVRFGVRYNF
ncbi:MAG TPA: carboxypeptidase regulatory-like domain-containing protein [Vicinamibacterales bacterium]|nr:carboxypeptidase regulatory-like domain-containing protein [Vicinamibacterales bacterium]